MVSSLLILDLENKNITSLITFVIRKLNVNQILYSYIYNLNLNLIHLIDHIGSCSMVYSLYCIFKCLGLLIII